MKILAAVLVVGALTLPVGGALRRLPDLTHEGLAGPVRSVSVEYAPLLSRRGKSVEGPRVPASVAVYDANGDQIDETRFLDGRPVERTSLRYTADGTQICESSVRTSDAVLGLVSLTSDSSGRSAEEHWRMDHQVLRSAYDSKGLRVETSIYEKLGSEEVGVSREEYGYDDTGRLVELRALSIDGVTREITRFTYAANGELVQKDILRGDATLERRIAYNSYRHDTRGNWTRRSEVETFAGGRIADQRVCYRAITYYDATKPRVEPRDRREVMPLARTRVGSCPFGAGALAGVDKLPGDPSPTMDRDGLFVAVALTNRYNPKKPDDTGVLAADEDRKASRARRVLRKRQRPPVDAALVDGDASTPRPDGGTEEPAIVPAR